MIAADSAIPVPAATLGGCGIYINDPAAVEVSSVTIFIPVVSDRAAGTALMPVSGSVLAPGFGPAVFVASIAIVRIGLIPTCVRQKIARVIGIRGEGVFKWNVEDHCRSC